MRAKLQTQCCKVGTCFYLKVAQVILSIPHAEKKENTKTIFSSRTTKVLSTQTIVMDYSCRDIPMRLDIHHQPLNFDIYLSQMIDVPRSSVDQQPYNFQLELQALEFVDQIIQRTQKEHETFKHQESDAAIQPNSSLEVSNCDQGTSKQSDNNNQCIILDHPPPIAQSAPLLPPSCPVETLLTPIKSSVTLTTNSCNTSDLQSSSEGSRVNQINLRDFEDTNYSPFDHLELQTIDELKELNLVFQASYANQTNDINITNNNNTNHLQPTLNTNQSTQNRPNATM